MALESNCLYLQCRDGFRKQLFKGWFIKQLFVPWRYKQYAKSCFPNQGSFHFSWSKKITKFNPPSWILMKLSKIKELFILITKKWILFKLTNHSQRKSKRVRVLVGFIVFVLCGLFLSVFFLTTLNKPQFHLICFSIWWGIPCFVITTSGALGQNQHTQVVIFLFPLNISWNICFNLCERNIGIFWNQHFFHVLKVALCIGKKVWKNGVVRKN